jgi:hypothetical protein
MVNGGRIKLIYFQLGDSLLNIRRDIQIIDVLKDLKFIWFADFVIGDNFFKQFREVELYKLHHPAINFFNCNHFFHLKKEKEKTNTFFSLLRLHGGTRRRHRNILAEKMQNKVYLKNAICKSNFAETKEKKDLLSADLELEYGKIHLSQGTWKDSLPVISLYEKTYFELVTETAGALDGDDSFYITEKTLKPIMMGHPFIMLSTKHFLKNLRGLGFKTFGDFIDESYDECDTVVERVEIISKNLERLDMDASKEFYEGTKEIQNHNQRHLMHLHGRYRFDLWHKFNNFFINL